MTRLGLASTINSGAYKPKAPIVFSFPNNIAYSQGLTIPLNASSPAPIRYTSTNPSVISISGNNASVLSAGNTTIIAQTDNSNSYYSNSLPISVLVSSLTTEVSSWLSKLTSNGISLPNQSVIGSVNWFIGYLRNNNLRSKIYRLNLFVAGTDWRAAFFPIICDAGASWDWNGIYGLNAAALSNSSAKFTSSMWTLTGGFDPSSVNSNIIGSSNAGAYLDTGIDLSSATFLSSLQSYDLHFATYVSSAGSKDSNTEIGYNGISSANPNYTYAALRANYHAFNDGVRGMPGFYTYSNSTVNPGSGIGTTNALVFSPDIPFDPRGFIVGTRANQSSTTFYKNGIISPAYVNLDTQPDPTAFSNPNLSTVSFSGIATGSGSVGTVCIFCAGANSKLGSSKTVSGGWSDRALTMYSIGKGLSDNDASTFSAGISNFNSLIGRANYL